MLQTVKRYAGAVPDGRGVHHDTPLANLAVAAFSDMTGFVAQKLFPIVPVGKQNDRYFVIDPDAWLRIPDTRRAPKSPPNQMGMRVSSDGYFADNYALRADNALEALANADAAIMLRENSAKMIVSALLRDYERRVANLVTSGTNLGSYVALAGGNKWSDYANSDPIGAVNTGTAFIENTTGITPNTLVLDSNTARVLQRHPLLLDMHKYVQGGLVPLGVIAQDFGVQNIYVANGVVNNALEAGTASMTTIWGNSAILAYVEPGVSLETRTFGLTMRWQPDGLPAPMSAVRYLDGDPGRHVEWTEVGVYQDEKVVAKNLSYGILSTL